MTFVFCRVPLFAATSSAVTASAIRISVDMRRRFLAVPSLSGIAWFLFFAFKRGGNLFSTALGHATASEILRLPGRLTPSAA